MSFIKNIFKKVSDVFTADAEDKADASLASTAAEGKTSVSDVLQAQDSGSSEPITEEFLESLEEELIRSDLGVTLSMDFVETLRKKSKSTEILEKDAPLHLKNFLLQAFESDRLPPGERVEDRFKLNINENALSIYLVVGVNGVGKTTSIGKLANRFQKSGKKVLIAAGDTFRAAAEDQLKVWASRSGADFIDMPHGSKSSALVYKAIEKCQAEGHDVLIIDTAGRLQNKKNLMQELSKIKEVVEKNANSLCETMLVLDASTGQNALSQAKSFMEVADLSSIILTKFDGTARAGVIFSIAHELHIPVKLVGTGEGVDDIEDFDPDRFVSKYL